MTEANPIVDQAGITRTPTGEIDNPTAQQGTTGQPKEESKPNTTPSENSDNKTLLNDKKPEGEQKPEDKKPELDKDGKPIEKKADDGKVPEKYDFKVPEGFKLDEKLSEQASTLFKEMGLSQENAQKLIDLNIQQLKAAAEGPAKAYSELTQKWRTDSENHPDLKGKLGEGQEINVRIGRFLNGLNDPQLASDFRALMDMTGAGNHQAFIRVIDAAARKLTEGSHVSGNGPSTGGQSAGNKPAPTAAEAMWPNLANRGQ